MALLNENQVPGWNRDKKKFMAFLRLVCQPLEGLCKMLEGYPNAFSLERAVGAQLDVLGALVGADRVLPFAPTTEGASRTLSDEDYRALIRATVAKNVWDGSILQLGQIFSTLFPDYGIVLHDCMNEDGDPETGCIRLVLSSIQSIPLLQQEMLSAGLLIPVPAGVRLYYEIPETMETAAVTISAGVYAAGETWITTTERSGG